mmetsp:Transcript_99264/g.248913  ORF Transcript_99264/g.248913 Transcript_99264/m.248913 type:complete len:220 (-) Transcript_99264:188-847(-)
MELASMREWDPILFCEIRLAARQPVANIIHRARKVHITCNVHLAYLSALGATIFARRRERAEGYVGLASIREYFGILRAGDDMANKSVVGTIVRLCHAQLSPMVPASGTQPIPRLELGSERRLSAQGPPVPGLHVQWNRPQQDLRVPRLIQHSSSRAVVPPVVLRLLHPVAPCSKDDLAILHADGGVHHAAHLGGAFGACDVQVDINQPIVPPEQRRKV